MPQNSRVQRIRTIDTHTMGEPTRIVVEGVPAIPGSTMLEKKEYIKRNLDYIRTSLLREPRGHRDMFGAIILPRVSPEADIGVVFMDNEGYLNMCGHGTIGVVTALLEADMIPCHSPSATVILETPAGLVETRAVVNESSVESVSFRNVPAFLWPEECTVDVPGIGPVTAEIAFGGNFFALVRARDLGLAITLDNCERLLTVGVAIRNLVNAKIKVVHPIKTEIDRIDIVKVWDDLASGEFGYRNVVIFGDHQIDRSPCGTGTCAKMAALHAKGRLGLNQPIVSESIIGTRFNGRLLDITTVGELPAVVPEITGRAFITGIHEFRLHPEDPVKHGFSLVG